MSEKNNNSFTCLTFLFFCFNALLFTTITYYMINYYDFLDANENYENNSINSTNTSYFNSTHTEVIYNTTHNDVIYNNTNDEKKVYSSEYIQSNLYHTLNINIYTISIYTIFYIGITCIIFRHFIGILFANLLFISVIIICYINYLLNTDCNDRYLLKCSNNTNLSHENISESKNALIYFILSSILFNIMFSCIMGICNSREKKYYINSFIFIETLVIFIGYYIFSLYFLLYPLFCCIGCGITKSVFTYIINGRKLPTKNFEIMA